MIHPRWHKTFLGVEQQHTYWLYCVIDEILKENPQITKFIEIGTGNGCLSVFLALHARMRDTTLLTMDIRPRHEGVQKMFDILDVNFCELNCFTPLAEMKIGQEMAGQPTLLFCDGGNKTKEFNHFAAALPVGSVIASHDYPMETRPDLIKDTIAKLGLKPLKTDQWTTGPDNIATCFYKRV